MPHCDKKMLSFFLTTKCNLCCRYCYNAKERNAIEEQTIPLDVAKAAIDWYFEKNEDEIVEYELRCAKKIILKKQPQMEREEIEQFLYRKGYSLEITKEAFEEV